jgi:hypothetical protein
MTSTELRQSVYSHNPDARRARQNLVAIRAEIERIGALMQFELTSTQGTHPDEPQIVSVGTSDTLDVLNRYHRAEKLITESAIAAEIPELDALYTQIAEAEVHEAEAATAAQAAQNALEEARAAALAKAEAKIDSDPAVKAARAKLDALGGPALVADPDPVVELPSDLLELESDHEELAGDFK